MEDKELDKLREDHTALMADYEIVKSKQAKGAIARVVREIDTKIQEEERRRSAVLKTRIVDGVEMQIPRSMYKHDHTRFHHHGGILYLIEDNGKRDADGSFHRHHYAWVPNGHKFTKLCVRTLGGDRYGNRAYINATHYKHPSDDWSYMETHVRFDSHQYRPYIEHILKEAMGWDFKTIKENMRRY
ncbi:hypothetical protein [Paenibacillus sp. MMO-177]|uniref:hypothetical protein n=1 Tax=Paenibacillus sp. MMO-177 TaxID=3081289 RepID=UPI0030197200